MVVPVTQAVVEILSDVSLNLIFPNLAEDEDDVEEDAEAAVTEADEEE